MSNKPNKNKPICLTVAGFDPSCGAGVAADLRVFNALECYGYSAISALTPQNSGGVKSVHPVDVEILHSQLESISQDVKVSAAKTGQIADIACAREIVRFFKKYDVPLVVDPLAVPTRGRRLASPEVAEYVRENLLPLASIITPNTNEASWLSGIKVTNGNSAEKAAKKIVSDLAKSVAITGIIKNELICDLFFDGSHMQWFRSQMLDVGDVHGTGCHYSSAICAYLAQGESLKNAVQKTKRKMSYWLSRKLLNPTGKMKFIDS